MTTQKELQHFCRNVLYLRKQAGLSQKEMASILHTSVSSLRKLESGILPQKMSVEVISRLASAFALPCAALFEPLETK